MAPIVTLNTSDFADQVRRDLLQLLEGVRGKKNLVIQKDLAGTVSLCVKFSTLQEYGVDRVFFLENDNVDFSQRNVVFLVRGEKAKDAGMVAEQVKRLRSESPQDHEFSIFWVPRRTLIANQILEDAGVLGEANVAELALQFVPLGDDLLSLELEDAFSDLYLRRDPTPIFASASALMKIQQQMGLFPRITGKGDHAKRLSELLIRMRSELTTADSVSNRGSSLGLNPSTSIESLVIIDREVDLPSVLLTQLTYEGLIDEFFHIESNQVELDTSITGTTGPAASQSSTSQQGLKRKVQLDGNDTLYGTLRDSNFAVVGPLLNRVARRLQSTYESRNTATKTTAELREFVTKLPGYQAEQASLKLHTNLAEEIIKHTRSETFSRVLEVQQNIAAGADPTTQHDNISELIARDVPLPTVLRLLCLESVMNGGLRARDLENFKRDILHAYGHQHLVTLTSLEKLGLLTARGGAAANLVGSQAGKPGTQTDYPRVRRTLQLIFDDVNESEPDDIAYAYSGYAPLSVRLVQCVLQKSYLATLSAGNRGGGAQQLVAMASTAGTQGWRPFEDALKSVRGVTVDETQTGEEKAVRARQILSGAREGGQLKTVVIFFLGGVCRAEIAAVRWVGRRLIEEGKNLRLVICTTAVVTGDRVVGAAIEDNSFSR
ncbi:Sec1-like protein [Rhizodiscina lignyota]|uniref:Sec1-like protein n=1 Tax=Rhizodiscina lignyota TaxID=1504668 RepID=A0A9P4M668_9PEZI|nr:Sec1-like protein [Rhizodiscina lignyota]